MELAAQDRTGWRQDLAHVSTNVTVKLCIQHQTILHCVPLKVVTVCGEVMSDEEQKEDHAPRRASSWGHRETGGRHTPGRCVLGRGIIELMPASAAACRHHCPVAPASTHYRYDTSQSNHLLVFSLTITHSLVSFNTIITASWHRLSCRCDSSHHHEWDILWATSPIHERHKLLVDQIYADYRIPSV